MRLTPQQYNEGYTEASLSEHRSFVLWARFIGIIALVIFTLPFITRADPIPSVVEVHAMNVGFCMYQDNQYTYCIYFRKFDSDYPGQFRSSTNPFYPYI